MPLSLPLALLLASLITFGNFGERYELLAMKAAGISLLKIMRPLIILVCIICGISFYFQNVIGPIAQGKLGTLLISMKQKSPELDIPEGVFYSEIPDYNLKVGKKDRKTGMLYDVLIYTFNDGAETVSYTHLFIEDGIVALLCLSYCTDCDKQKNEKAFCFHFINCFLLIINRYLLCFFL